MSEESTSILTLSHFTSLQGQELLIRLDGQEWTAEITEAEPLTKHGPEDFREPFSLLLKTQVPGLPQGNYELITPQGDPILMLLVPIGGNESSTHLQAIFN